ncbi:MAG: hypothetical protein AB1938_23415 [Myxococcota bacterium]
MIRVTFAVTALLATSALADLTLTSEGVSAGKPRTITLQLKDKRLLITIVRKEDGGHTAVVRDGDGKRTLVIDHAGKTYAEMTDAQMAELKARTAQMQEGLASKLAGLPADQRARLEAMMKSAGKPASPTPHQFTFEKKGKSRKVAGYACEEYLVKVDGVADGEGCFISWKDAGVSREALHEQLSAVMDGLPGGVDAFEASFAAETAPGLPAWRKRVSPDGTVLSEMTLKKLSTDTLAASAFELPKGYTARASPFGPPPGGPGGPPPPGKP